VERRRAKRYTVALPVQLMQRGTGVTRNMSTSGFFFETEKAQAVGEAIEFSVEFSDATVECNGRVVRVESLDDKFRVAVELTRDVVFRN
jgi:PilZ domain-containing protein